MTYSKEKMEELANGPASHSVPAAMIRQLLEENKQLANNDILRYQMPFGMHISTIILNIQKYYSSLPSNVPPPTVEFEFNGLVIKVNEK
jgi:hypothetical protein